MEIRKTELKINPISFTPELLVEVLFDMEATTDLSALDPNFYEKFGREFFNQLNAKSPIKNWAFTLLRFLKFHSHTLVS